MRIVRFPVGRAHAQWLYRGAIPVGRPCLADGRIDACHVSLTSKDGSDLPKLALEQLMEKEP